MLRTMRLVFVETLSRGKALNAAANRESCFGNSYPFFSAVRRPSDLFCFGRTLVIVCSSFQVSVWQASDRSSTLSLPIRRRTCDSVKVCHSRLFSAPFFISSFREIRHKPLSSSHTHENEQTMSTPSQLFLRIQFQELSSLPTPKPPQPPKSQNSSPKI